MFWTRSRIVISQCIANKTVAVGVAVAFQTF